MFDVLLKSKFHVKCKTAIKLTKKRLEMIKRKRNAMEKFLKKDIADLLRDGLDINAYGRAEGLLIELNMSACYDFVMKFCVCLYAKVSLMDNQSDCPEECREAVHSLMHAAARFADMPELRELRAILLAKYGQFLEAYINHEFVEKLKAKPPTKEMKIQLLQVIALESGKTWDSKALEQKLYVPPSSEYGLSENTKDEIANKTKKEIENNRGVSSVPSSPRKIKDLPSYRTRKTNENKHKLQENENKNKPTNESSPEKDVQKTKPDENKPFQRKFAPPPYHRRANSEIQSEFQAKADLENTQKNEHNTPKGHEEERDEIKYYQRKFTPVKSSDEKQSFQSKFAPPPASYIEEKTQEQDDLREKAKPKAKSVRSVRSRRSMVPPNEEKTVEKEDTLDAIRRELATKPGHKSSDIDDDLRNINEALKHHKRDSSRVGKGLQLRK